MPYRDRKLNKDIERLLHNCTDVWIASDTYHKGCYLERDRIMVEKSSKIIGVSDGRKGSGTAYTLKYASKQQVDMDIILIE